MKLIYIWFEKCRCFNKEGIILDKRYEVFKEKDKFSFTVNKIDINSLYKKYRVDDVYVMLGKKRSRKINNIRYYGISCN